MLEILAAISLVSVLIIIGILVVSAIPLNIAVKVLGGESSIIKVIIVNILVGASAAILALVIDKFLAIASFIVMIFIYKEMFKIGWIKAFFAWVFQGVIIAGIVFGLLFVGFSIV